MSLSSFASNQKFSKNLSERAQVADLSVKIKRQSRAECPSTEAVTAPPKLINSAQMATSGSSGAIREAWPEATRRQNKEVGLVICKIKTEATEMWQCSVINKICFYACPTKKTSHSSSFRKTPYRRTRTESLTRWQKTQRNPSAGLHWIQCLRKTAS